MPFGCALGMSAWFSPLQGELMQGMGHTAHLVGEGCKSSVLPCCPNVPADKDVGQASAKVEQANRRAGKSLCIGGTGAHYVFLLRPTNMAEGRALHCSTLAWIHSGPIFCPVASPSVCLRCPPASLAVAGHAAVRAWLKSRKRPSRAVQQPLTAQNRAAV